MCSLRLLCLLLLKVGLLLAYTTDYDGYQLWRVENVNEDKAPNLLYLIDGVWLDVWASGPSWLDVMVPPYLVYSLDDALRRLGLRKRVLIEDLQSLIEKESKHNRDERVPSNIIGEYLQLEEIEAFMQDLSTTYEWVIVESIGQTFEGRDLFVNKLSVPGEEESKPSVWIECGIHPRAWISQATCVYGLSYLTESYSVVDEVTDFLDSYDVYIMPVLNPDGYYYSWHNDRFWRKNRVDERLHRSCSGVDLNLNYDDGHWGGEGTSDNPCSEIYIGPEGFSELETIAVRDFTTQLIATNNLTSFFSLSSYGQLWLYPYGWTDELHLDSDAMYEVSEAGVNAIQEDYGSSYDFGRISNVLYPTTGSPVDWAYSVGIVHSYALLLRDTGMTGFLLPSTEIVPCAEEAWHGIIQGILTI